MEMHANTCRLDSVAMAGIGVSGGEVLLLINLGVSSQLIGVAFCKLRAMEFGPGFELHGLLPGKALIVISGGDHEVVSACGYGGEVSAAGRR
jgi:hypothetical protein